MTEPSIVSEFPMENIPVEARRMLSRGKRDVLLRKLSSHGSHNSQQSKDFRETTKDVYFPQFPQDRSHANGVDFSELEKFSRKQKLANDQLFWTALNIPENKGCVFPSVDLAHHLEYPSRRFSADVRYTPKPPTMPHIQSDESKVPNEEIESANISPVGFSDEMKVKQESEKSVFVPNRFSFFRSEGNPTVHSPDIPCLVQPRESFYDLFEGGKPTWWLDCCSPTDDELRCISKAFGIHPLTSEDIKLQEPKEKVQLFRSYYFVCFNTFESDRESEEFLEAINVYTVVFKNGMLTFHFSPMFHCSKVRKRVRQLKDFVDVSADWLCYALIDNITDSFAPVIQSLEYDADVIEDSVFMVRQIDFSAMLQKIGESRKKTMTLTRLLAGKADVIRMFVKRCQDGSNANSRELKCNSSITDLQSSGQQNETVQPRADVALYLGDIEDHLLTMFQNLAEYEKIFSRSFSNYLTQLQVESFNANNRISKMLGYAAMVGTIFVPLHLIPGLFGMNVKVPGQHASSAWWYVILGCIIGLAFIGWVFAKNMIDRISTSQEKSNDVEESRFKLPFSNLSRNCNTKKE
ncbi:magnesium transporter CorA family protein KNAG_0I00820 [Huiozyma naganishii CBS 8797]|uniref:Magnesium transporter n=1 Tax=Huiozyma naganishii (strain ATCC MYA-139 / BCRC 22969 / CBS 8797 / KCTC 17520 / NBRC 10181 / NCYC 3082 / Yp74L-3) TaxID=1071383 RepID=J7RQ30_HUIN7|nr:hypothetical protein KNAG_0I00820 [Kazachstania naganishii CBS 8797]CCK71873.1 hypothetical protein KNAG_0I00820 [Kazachstania naganishii CBS 8797]